MTDPSVDHRAITPSEGQAHQSDVHEAGVDVNDLYLTTCESISADVQIKWTYFLLGCAILLPWNALVNATSFFLSRLAGSPFYPTFSSYLSSVVTLTKLGCQFYCTITSKQSSPSRRIYASIIGMILLVTSLCLSTFVRGTPPTFFAFALFNAALSAVATGYLCTAVYAGAALFGTSYLRIVFSGQAAIAVVISVVQVASSIIAISGLPPKSTSMQVTANGRDGQAEEMAARIFFGASIVFLCITLVAYIWLARQPFYRSVTGPLEQLRRGGDMDELTRLLTDDGRNPSEPKSNVYQVFIQNLIFMFSIAYVFAVTLAIYPAITARVQPVNPGFHPLLFTAFHFLVYNVGDLLGRESCSFPCLVVWSAKKILAMSLFRTLFIPLILLCNIKRPATTTPIHPPIIHSDALFMIIILAMGYTNGHVSTLALLGVSSVEHNPGLKGRREDVDVAAMLGGSFVMLGLAVGALSSFGVQAMV